MAVALGLRLIGLGHESIWYDEACTLDMVNNSFRDMLTGRKLEPSNPAGYFMLLRAFRSVGSTAPKQVAEQMARWQERLKMTR